MDEKIIIYAAGFFDGEGSCYDGMYLDKRRGKEYPRLTAKMSQIDRTPLDRIVQELGCGGVYKTGDKRVEQGFRECHQAVFTHKSARLFLTAIEPYLIVKKEKVSQLLDKHGRTL